MFAQSMTSSRERGDRRTGKSFQRKKRPLKGYEAVSILLRVFFLIQNSMLCLPKLKKKKKSPEVTHFPLQINSDIPPILLPMS